MVILIHMIWSLFNESMMMMKKEKKDDF